MVKMLVCGLKSRQEINGSIKKLDLSGSPIGVEGVAHLQKIPLESLQGISYLYISYCFWDSTVPERVSGALDLLSRLVPTMTSLKELDISQNPAGHGETVNILKALSTMNQLQSLYIEDINLGPTDIMALFQLIRPSVGHVKELKIGDEGMSREDMEMMSEAVLCPSSLESLKLFNVDFTPRVNSLLQDNHNLIKLSVMSCISVTHIAEGLHRQTTLRELCVCTFVGIEQPPTDSIILSLSEMLRRNQSLKSMTLRADFTQQNVQTLVSALQDNHTLEQLYLEYHGWEFLKLKLDQLDPRVSLSLPRLYM